MQKGTSAIAEIQKAEVLELFLYTIIYSSSTAKNMSADGGNNGSGANPFVRCFGRIVII